MAFMVAVPIPVGVDPHLLVLQIKEEPPEKKPAEACESL
jgi:hypothetical protein